MTDRDYVAEIMEARGDLPLPSPVDAVLFLITEMGEYIDATLRQKPEYERNNAKAHTPEEELGDMWHMLNVVRYVSQNDLHAADNNAMIENMNLLVVGLSTLLDHVLSLSKYTSFRSGIEADRLVRFAESYYGLSADDIHAAAIAKLQRRNKPEPDYVTCGCGRANKVYSYNGKWICPLCYREATCE